MSPEILKIGAFPLRWYSLLFAAPFVIGTPIWYAMFSKAGKTIEEADWLRVYLVVSVMLGARLGHVFFYEWDYYKHHLMEIVLPVVVFHPQFKFVGFSGLASHGAAVGIVLAMFFYVYRLRFSLFPIRIQLIHSKKTIELLWLLDRLMVLVALGGMCIRLGNFMNSEIIGKPTHNGYGVVFVRNVHNYLARRYASTIQELSIRKAPADGTPLLHKPYQPIQLAITFNQSIQEEAVLQAFLEKNLKDSLVVLSYDNQPRIYETYGTPLRYQLTKEADGKTYRATVYTWGIPRHPAQLYEAFSCLLIFIVLFAWWRRKGEGLTPGRIAGTFLVVLFSLRFFYEFYKENQVPFEDAMCLNMGQWLSIPWVLAGIVLLLRPGTKKMEQKTEIS
ncbi:MAG TPA: prolipoprotein diacylglyceryl transferase [Amoebophilaceae bacterium]|nr:prolipoprotein diacylglyceryl transferase [Amoebophilaceae bacterium]